MHSQDHLKYWRVVRYFIKKKYNLTTSDLEMLLFLKLKVGSKKLSRVQRTTKLG